MTKDKIQVRVPRINKTYVIERDFKNFRNAHIDMLGNGYNAEGYWLGVSKKIQVSKNEFRIITDEDNVIIYTLFQ